MRKLSYALSLFAAIFILTIFYCESGAPRILSAAAPAYERMDVFHTGQDILRLHVVANSDSRDDQRVKLLVRDALIERFAPAASLRQAEELLLGEGADVLATVEGVLREQGCGYGAQLRFGVMDFPDKEYAGVAYPAGEYEALRVELGDAGGKNWWCVLFPPLCLIDIGVQDLPDTDELVFESDILNWIQECLSQKNAVQK